MLTVLPELSRTVVGTAAFTGLRDGGSRPDLGCLQSSRQKWRKFAWLSSRAPLWGGGRVGEPKKSRSKAAVPLIPPTRNPARTTP